MRNFGADLCPSGEVTHSKLYWVVLGQGCLRGEVSHSIRLYRGLKREGHHPEGEESKKTRGREVAYMSK